MDSTSRSAGSRSQGIPSTRNPASEKAPGTTPLYPRIVGERWRDLPERLRRHFEASGEQSASGRFRVRQGDGVLARSLARLGRLPRPGEDIEVALTVTPDASGETWSRCFGEDELVSRQWEERGFLTERIGSIELRFRLVVSEGRLLFHQVAAGLRMGGARIPLPRRLSPQVTARAWEDGRIHVSVEVRCPGVGLLCHYEGTLERRETPR